MTRYTASTDGDRIAPATVRYTRTCRTTASWWTPWPGWRRAGQWKR